MTTKARKCITLRFAGPSPATVPERFSAIRQALALGVARVDDDGVTLIGTASDGAIVTLGTVDTEQGRLNAEDYLRDRPHPIDW